MKGKVNRTFDFTLSENEVRALEIALRNTISRANEGKLATDYVEQMEEIHQELVSHLITSGDTYDKRTGGVRESESSDDSSLQIDKDHTIRGVMAMVCNGDISPQLGQEVIDDIIYDRLYTQDDMKKEFDMD